MSERGKFLGRWSRRKQKAAKLAKKTTVDESRPAQTENRAAEKKTDKAASTAELAKKTAEAFDMSSLPPIDSIVATTDIRPFLAPGVPAELTRAALQKAWRSDPAIRDFIGLSENSWDFNDPNGMHGFGPLQLTDELKQIVTQMLGSFPAGDSDQTEKAQKPEEPSIDGGPEAAAAFQNKIEQERKMAPIVDAKAGNEKNILFSGGILAQQQVSYENVATQKEMSLQKDNDLKPKGRHGSALPRK